MDSLSTLSDSAVCGTYSIKPVINATCYFGAWRLIVKNCLQLQWQEDTYLTLHPAQEQEVDLRLSWGFSFALATPEAS